MLEAGKAIHRYRIKALQGIVCVLKKEKKHDDNKSYNNYFRFLFFMGILWRKYRNSVIFLSKFGKR